MMQVAKLIELTFLFGVYATPLAFAAATIWYTLALPGSRAAVLVWLIGAAVNGPFLLVMLHMIAAGQDFALAWQPTTLLMLVAFYGVGAFGFGWLAGIMFGSFFRLLAAMESRQHA